MANQPYPQDPRGPGYAPPPGPNDDTVESVKAPGVAMERQRESYMDSSGNRVENQVETYEDTNLRKASLRNWITGVVYFLLGVLEVILGLRFIFRLLGANEGSDFTRALYDFSHIFVGPFNGIFNDQTIGSRSVFELSTLVAMLIYALIAWGLVSLARVLLSPTYGGRRVSTTRRRQNF
jgi:hypothetical protein